MLMKDLLEALSSRGWTSSPGCFSPHESALAHESMSRESSEDIGVGLKPPCLLWLHSFGRNVPFFSQLWGDGNAADATEGENKRSSPWRTSTLSLPSTLPVYQQKHFWSSRPSSPSERFRHSLATSCPCGFTTTLKAPIRVRPDT